MKKELGIKQQGVSNRAKPPLLPDLKYGGENAAVATGEASNHVRVDLNRLCSYRFLFSRP